MCILWLIIVVSYFKGVTWPKVFEFEVEEKGSGKRFKVRNFKTLNRLTNLVRMLNSRIFTWAGPVPIMREGRNYLKIGSVVRVAVGTPFLFLCHRALPIRNVCASTGPAT